MQVDNYTVLSAPSFFDYDALVIDPHAAGLLIEGVLDGTLPAHDPALDPNRPSAPSIPQF